MERKGIILAGGKGTRLYPITSAISKQLMPIYDKPMVYYPLCTLMLAGIREILIITRSKDLQNFKDLLGDGSQWGLDIQFKEQQNPNGIAEAFQIGEKFLDNKPSALILGDNIYYGNVLSQQLKNAYKQITGATIFVYYVSEPSLYGVVEWENENNGLKRVLSIEEKPKFPKSNFAVTGLYFYDENVIDVSKTLRPSERGELEITDLNQLYLKAGKLNVEVLGRGVAWLDTGNFDALLEACFFIRTLEKRQGLKISCPEEIAWRNGWINDDEMLNLALNLKKSGYGKYLENLLNY